MKNLAILFTTIFLCTQANADDDAQAILGASSGIWEGELYYLDYQSGQRFGIPLKIDASMTPDGATLIRRMTYTDPNTLVHAVSLTSINRSTGELAEAYFREGQGEILRATVTETSFTSESIWTLVYQQEGTDADRQATIRHTLQRDGNTLTSSKEVRFEDEDEFVLRNGIAVELVE